MQHICCAVHVATTNAGSKAGLAAASYMQSWKCNLITEADMESCTAWKAVMHWPLSIQASQLPEQAWCMHSSIYAAWTIEDDTSAHQTLHS